MTLWHKRALVSTLIWVVATTVFLLGAFSGDGPAGLEDVSPRRNLAGAAIACGLILHFLVRIITRPRQDKPGTRVDERDREIDNKATQISLGVTVAGIFIGCIMLHDAFQTTGAVPVNWVWFVGYSGFILSHLAWAVLSVIMYSGNIDHGQG